MLTKMRIAVVALLVLFMPVRALPASAQGSPVAVIGDVHSTSDKGPVMGPDPWKERLDLVARVMEAQAVPSDAARDLAGSWQLVKFQGGDGKVLVPDDKANYTLAFEEGGGVSVRIDCNRGRGTWRSAAPSQLVFGPLALTRAMCPPAPLTDRLAKDWSYVRSYVIRDGRLFLSLMADAGIYEFERQ
jgi:para-nitrobenzyl esterase